MLFIARLEVRKCWTWATFFWVESCKMPVLLLLQSPDPKLVCLPLPTFWTSPLILSFALFLSFTVIRSSRRRGEELGEEEERRRRSKERPVYDILSELEIHVFFGGLWVLCDVSSMISLLSCLYSASCSLLSNPIVFFSVSEHVRHNCSLFLELSLSKYLLGQLSSFPHFFAQMSSCQRILLCPTVHHSSL